MLFALSQNSPVDVAKGEVAVVPPKGIKLGFKPQLPVPPCAVKKGVQLAANTFTAYPATIMAPTVAIDAAQRGIFMS